MKELIIVRHGQSEHHVKGITGGWTDLPLTAFGRQQAVATGHRLDEMLAGRAFHFCSSDLKRALETAQIIGDIIGKEPQVERDLRELNNGMAKNLPLEEARKMENPFSEPAIDWIPYPEGESWRMLHHRICRFMNRIRDERQEDLAVMVSHSNAMICMIHWWLGIHEDHHLANIMYHLDPCCIVHLKLDKHGCRTIVKLNDTSHLNRLSQTPTLE
ncbi:histidine phosphatase family protein [Staphylospora marina]|uniref:histidine phosphatase family protein n=1 Tax=Staphylospora marina TaxID=2490858 RepID=UPI0013DDFA6F|nr:histidine phosphatase family protein [Staphylospora marina]